MASWGAPHAPADVAEVEALKRQLLELREVNAQLQEAVSCSHATAVQGGCEAKPPSAAARGAPFDVFSKGAAADDALARRKERQAVGMRRWPAPSNTLFGGACASKRPMQPDRSSRFAAVLALIMVVIAVLPASAAPQIKECLWSDSSGCSLNPSYMFMVQATADSYER